MCETDIPWDLNHQIRHLKVARKIPAQKARSPFTESTCLARSIQLGNRQGKPADLLEEQPTTPAQRGSAQ